jgi:hypothetical protein
LPAIGVHVPSVEPTALPLVQRSPHQPQKRPVEVRPAAQASQPRVVYWSHSSVGARVEQRRSTQLNPPAHDSVPSSPRQHASPASSHHVVLVGPESPQRSNSHEPRSQAPLQHR